MTERMRSQVQASEMSFLRRIEGVTLFNKVRSSEVRKSLNIEPLLPRIERSQLRWFGHEWRMPQERLPKQALLAKANGRKPVGRPIELQGPITLRILDGIAWDFARAKWWRWWKTMSCGGSILSYCPRNPHWKAGNEERKRRKRKRTQKHKTSRGAWSRSIKNLTASTSQVQTEFKRLHAKDCLNDLAKGGWSPSVPSHWLCNWLRPKKNLECALKEQKQLVVKKMFLCIYFRSQSLTRYR